MKVKLVIFLLMPILLGCISAPKRMAVIDTYFPAKSKKEITSTLEAIYHIADSTAKIDSLDQFFKRWNSSIPPNKTVFVNQNDTIKAVFQVFRVLYKPFDLLKLGGWEWGNKLNANAKYAAIQNKIYYSILATDDLNGANNNVDSILNFRPVTNIPEIQVVYLTTEFREALYNFLGSDESELGEGNIMNPSQPKGESQRRYQLLRPFIPILHGHNTGWNIGTSPTIESIKFNKSLTLAKVQFIVGYEGGEAIVKKVGNEWIIASSKATWIE